jgi:hypothetical protein
MAAEPTRRPNLRGCTKMRTSNSAAGLANRPQHVSRRTAWQQQTERHASSNQKDFQFSSLMLVSSSCYHSANRSRASLWLGLSSTCLARRRSAPRTSPDQSRKNSFEPLRCQSGIARRVLNVAMPEIRLDRACVVSIVGELIAAGMAQHVGMRDRRRRICVVACDVT